MSLCTCKHRFTHPAAPSFAAPGAPSLCSSVM